MFSSGDPTPTTPPPPIFTLGRMEKVAPWERCALPKLFSALWPQMNVSGENVCICISLKLRVHGQHVKTVGHAPEQHVKTAVYVGMGRWARAPTFWATGLAYP